MPHMNKGQCLSTASRTYYRLPSGRYYFHRCVSTHSVHRAACVHGWRGGGGVCMPKEGMCVKSKGGSMPGKGGGVHGEEYKQVVRIPLECFWKKIGGHWYCLGFADIILLFGTSGEFCPRSQTQCASISLTSTWMQNLAQWLTHQIQETQPNNTGNFKKKVVR